MITRQKAILRLLANEGGATTKLRLVKLAFLLRQTAAHAPASGTYEFLPYHYGPYSFTLSYDLRSLERDGWIRILDANLLATRPLMDETSSLDRSFRWEIDNLVEDRRSVSTDELVRSVYRDYPWFTARAKNLALRANLLPVADLAVYTVGYEGLMLDGFLDLLLRNGIRQLADVRCNPVARRFGFHKSTLARHCADVGIDYIHLPELGIPSGLRQSLNSTEAYTKLFAEYERQILPANGDALATASRLLCEKPTALMCMEADARCCHRTSLARELASRTSLPLRELRCL